MHVSSWMLLGLLELFLVLIALCLFLLFHSRKLKELSKNLQSRIKKLVKDLKTAKAEVKEIKAQLEPGTAYKKQINDQLQITRDYHDTLEADQDIALDLDTNVSIERQTAALRHAILIAEKEAAHSSNTEKPNWNVLTSKFSLLLDYYKGGKTTPTTEQSADSDELATYKQRVENLEKFKQLYFDLEQEWQDAQEKANEYQMQLSSYATQVDDAESFEAILNHYEKAYSSIGGLINNMDATNGQTQGATTIIEKVKVVQHSGPERAHNSELDRLRNVAVDQHRTISELKKKLVNAATAEAQQAIVADLERELNNQTRFIKEAETCVQLLEDELDSANTRLAHLEKKLSQKDKSLSEYTRLESALQKAEQEKQQLLQTQKTLQSEISQLEALFEHAGAGSNEETEKALSQLRSDYAKLEERYLALKMK